MWKTPIIILVSGVCLYRRCTGSEEMQKVGKRDNQKTYVNLQNVFVVVTSSNNSKLT